MPVMNTRAQTATQSLYEKANGMKKTHHKRRGKRLAAFLMASAMGLAVNAAAGEVGYDVTGLSSANNISGGSNSSLQNALTDINTAVSTDTAQYQADAVITIGNNQTANAAVQTGFWNLHGTTNSNVPNYSILNKGFHDVTITGRSATDKTVLSAGSTNTALLRVYRVDGDLKMENIKVTGGKIVGDGTTGSGGAGMSLGADGTTYEQKAADSITLKNIDADGNSITIANNLAGGNAFGAGIEVNAYGVDSGGNLDGHSNVAFESVNLTGNTIEFTNATGGGDVSIRGGGARVGYAQSFTYTGGTVSRNAVTLTMVDTPAATNPHAAGGGLSIDGAAAVMEKVVITGVSFSENTVTMNNNVIPGVNPATYARGGAVYIATTGTGTSQGIAIGSTGSTTSFNKNAALAASTSGKQANAHGGALFMFTNDMDATLTNVTFSENYAKSTAGEAVGGAIGVQTNAGTAGDLTVSGVTFSGNYVDGSTNAYGGAVASYNNSTHTITNSDFSENYAKAADKASGGAVSFLGGGANSIDGGKYKDNYAVSSASAGTARGGAIYSAGGTLNIKNATLDGNHAEAAATGGKAQGGAIYMEQGALTLTDSSVTNNWVSGGSAEGSAIYMNTDSGTADLTLEATANKTVKIAGNTEGGANGVNKSGIYYGNANGGSSNADAYFTATGAGHIELLDPLNVEMDHGKYFTMTKNNTGSFRWDGVNSFQTDGGISSLQLNNGSINLGSSFTAKAAGTNTHFKVDLNNVASLNFDLARDNTVALFDFTAATTKSMSVTGLTRINAGNVGRAVASFNGKKYLLVSGLGGSSHLISDGTNGFYLAGGKYVTSGSIYDEGGDLYANISFRSPLESNRNSYNAMYALDHMVNSTWGQANISDAEVAAMRANANNVTPELYMDQGFVMINATDRVARTAVDYGLRFPHRSQVALDGAFDRPRTRSQRRAPGYVEGARGVESNGAYPRLMDCSYARGGIRIWTGYLGDWRKVDSHGGYNGYKVDRNGFLLGVNYDFDTIASVGIYGGYSYSKTRARGADAEIKSDTGHLGAMARLSPLADRSFSLYGDLGYHFSNNDSRRSLSGWDASGSFDQNTFTMGLGAEYALNVGGFGVTPHAEVRYVGISQDDMTESGSSHTATTVKGFDEDSFNTRLGVELSKDFVTSGMAITPRLNVDWRHEYGSGKYTGRANYYDPSGPIPFTVSSAPIDRDSLDIGAAVKALKDFGGTKVGFNLSYNLNISRRSDTHSVYAGVEVGF